MPRGAYAGVVYWILFLVFIIWAVSHDLAQPPTPPGHNQETGQTEHKDNAGNPKGEGGKTFWERTTDDPVAFFTFWLAMFTAVLSVSTIGLWIVTWRAGRRQTDDMQASIRVAENSAQSQLRAYLSVVNITVYRLRDRFPARNEWQLAVHWMNTGQTPTRTLTTYIAPVLESEQLPDNYRIMQIDSKIRRGGFLAPHSTIRTTSGEIFTAQDLINVRDERKFLYIFGWIRYNDIFPNTPERVTRFCYRIMIYGDVAGAGPNGEGVEGRWSPHIRGNCADEECDREDQMMEI